jgi:hypothetical protein
MSKNRETDPSILLTLSEYTNVKIDMVKMEMTPSLTTKFEILCNNILPALGYGKVGEYLKKFYECEGDRSLGYTRIFSTPDDYTLETNESFIKRAEVIRARSGEAAGETVGAMVSGLIVKFIAHNGVTKLVFYRPIILKRKILEMDKT